VALDKSEGIVRGEVVQARNISSQSVLKNGQIRCADYNANEVIEKAAEAFAAEFIYPSQEFLDCVSSIGLEHGKLTPKEVVQLKRVCAAPVSYKFLQKRLEWFGFIERGEFAKVQFQKLEEEIFGTPIYRQARFMGDGLARRRRGS
jgi:Zn-dependent peptidase ImmA (M78 family)